MTVSTAFASELTAYDQARYPQAALGGWSNPGNVIGPPDGNCSNMGAVGVTNHAYSFDFDIPVGAVITGITAYTKIGENGNQNVGIQLASDASVEPPVLIGNARTLMVVGSGGSCAATTEHSIGPVLADWGAAGITRDTINDPGFGVIFTKVQQSSLKVDSICLEVRYDLDGAGGSNSECFDEPQSEGNNLSLVKVVVGEPPASDWEFEAEGPDIVGTVFLPAAGGSMQWANLNDDIYSFTETPKPGYRVTSECYRNDALIQSSDNAISIAVGEILGTSAVCVFTNTRIAQYAVYKDFTDDNSNPVSISLTCSSGTVTNSPQFVEDGAGPAVFNIEGFSDGVTCTASESVPAGYEWTNPQDCTDIDFLQVESCIVVNEPVLNFHVIVQKDFNDDNTAGVPIYIECTTGLPMSSDATLYEFHPIFDQIEFIVDAYDPGELDCTVYEDVPEGYESSYSAGYGDDGEANVDPYDSSEGCHFKEVIGGHFTCDITNTLQAVEVVVDKIWIDDQASENGAFLFAGAKWRCSPVANLNEDRGFVFAAGDRGHLTFHGALGGYREAGDPARLWDYDSFNFYPHFEGSTCSVTELELDSDVFSDDSDCDEFEILPGYDLDGEPTCVIINTRIYAGIPTLSEYGLALLALLMLGIGFVGYRRFA